MGILYDDHVLYTLMFSEFEVIHTHARRRLMSVGCKQEQNPREIRIDFRRTSEAPAGAC